MNAFTLARPNRRRPLTHAALLAVLLATGTAAGQTLSFHHQGAATTDLTVGDTLAVSLHGAAALTVHQIVLSDETGAEVAAATAFTDSLGDSAAVPLWSYSGVVGCDEDADPDPDAYRFSTYPAAETALGGRTFLVEARTPGQTGLPVATRSLALVARAGQTRFYHADATGCPRYRLRPEEDVYLAAIHLPLGSPTTYFIDGIGVPTDRLLPTVTASDTITTSGTSTTLVELVYRPEEICFFQNSYLPADGPIDQPGGSQIYCPLPSQSPYVSTVNLRIAPVLVTGRNVNPQVACPPCP